VPFEDGGLKVWNDALVRNPCAQIRGHQLRSARLQHRHGGRNVRAEVPRVCARSRALNFNTNDYDVPNFHAAPREPGNVTQVVRVRLAYSVYEGVLGVERQPPPFDFQNRTLHSVRRRASMKIRHCQTNIGTMVGPRALCVLSSGCCYGREHAIHWSCSMVKPYPGLDPDMCADELRDGQRELLEREAGAWISLLEYLSLLRELLEPTPERELATVLAVSEIDGHPKRSRTQSTLRRSSITSSLTSSSC